MAAWKGKEHREELTVKERPHFVGISRGQEVGMSVGPAMYLNADILVKDTEYHDWPGGEYNVEERDSPFLIVRLPREPVVEREPHLSHVEADVLVEGVRDELGDTAVREAAVDKKEALKEAELGDRVVRCTGSLWKGYVMLTAKEQDSGTTSEEAQAASY
jgi:hypothetical protein